MPIKKVIQPGEKVPLRLTAAERKLIADDRINIDPTFVEIVRDTPPRKPVMLTLDDLEDFCGWIAAEANHTEDEKLERTLDGIFEKVEELLDWHTDEEPPQTIRIEEGTRAKEIPVQPDSAKPKESNFKQPKAKVSSTTLRQLKITLLRARPLIWRRIQVQECTLDKLHEHIQTAMGWTNSHLHQFKIGGQYYGDPLLIEDDMAGLDYTDSTVPMLSDILPKDGQQFTFCYEYDFGDSWEHEILFEGYPPVENGKKYPLCLDGERACPPEDVGGVRGYEEFLKAIADPKHEEHDSFLQWCGGKFSPETFDPAKATKEMKKGLPDWRTMNEDDF